MFVRYPVNDQGAGTRHSGIMLCLLCFPNRHPSMKVLSTECSVTIKFLRIYIRLDLIEAPCETYRECSFLPSKKPRLDDGLTSRQARVDDDVWGEDLDADTVEECFILASQALSQVHTPDEVKQLGDSWPRSSGSPQLL